MKKISGILFLAVLLFNIPISGQTQVKISDQIVNLSGKKYYLHKVEPGQTLYSVSKAYKVSREDIKQTNNLSSDEIKSGQLLKIPFKEKISETDTSPDFFYHKVVKGETLFSLSQKYYVTVEDIINTNPEVKYGLKAGQILKIPNAFKKKREEQNKDFFLYTVEAGNTLFSISREYEISVDELIKLNPKAENGIKIGQKLKIPKKIAASDNNNRKTKGENTADTVNTGLNDPLYFTEPGITPCSNFEYQKGKTFNVALLMPLFIEQNLNYISRYNKEKDPMFFKNTKRFIEFYEGALLALNKVKEQGLSVNITVYDTENNSDKVRNIMSSLNYPDIDLIIGPVYSKNVKIAGKFAKEHKINLISPLSKKDTLLVNNPFIFQVTPSITAEIDRAAELLRTKNDSINLILVHNDTKEQKELINRFRYNYVADDTLNILSDTSVLKILRYDTDIEMLDAMQKKISKFLKPGYKNVVFIPSNNEVFVTQVIDKFYAAISQNEYKYKVVLIGSKKWINFQNFNSDYFEKLDFNFISPSYINYNTFEVKKFIKNYRTVYKTEPSEFAFVGYDITVYFLNALRKYGRIFQFCLSPEDAFPSGRGLIYKFNFKRSGLNNGFENKNTFILKFNEKFRLEEADFSEIN